MLRKTFLMMAVVALFGLGLASHANATLMVGDDEYVGKVVDGIPSNPANEIVYINTLIDLAPGAGPITIDGQDYDRIDSTVVTGDDAMLAGAMKDDSEDVVSLNLTGTYEYILAKYDASMAGSLVWYFSDGITGVVTPQAFLDGHSLSHISAYNAVGSGPIPEPASMIIWGLLASAGLCVGWRRRRRAA